MKLRPTTLVLLMMTAAATATVRAGVVEDALDTLHAGGAGLQSLAADVSLSETSSDTGDAKTHVGQFVLQRLPNGDSRLRVSFTKTTSGKTTTDDRRDVLLDGPTLIDRDYKAKKQTTRQVREPGAKVDLFKLGEGPFPLPIGQRREDVLKAFDVKSVPTTDAAALATLELIPKSGTKLASKFKTITVQIDRATKLPAWVETVDPNETTTTKAVLTNVRQNAAVQDSEFKLDPIDPKAWDLVDTR